jgi:hypothetical protein
VAKCVRIVIPDRYDKLRAKHPKLAARLSDRFVDGKGAWG